MESFEKLVVSVSQLNNYIKGLFDEIPVFRNVYVSGEISNFTNHYRSGHFYFALKDDKAIIKAVMFRSNASRLKFTPQNGMEVLVKARLSVFERDGVYQLYVEEMQPKGYGSLSLAYEQLKEKLAAAGLFAPEHKKPIPAYPSKIGVITSPTGAAIRDITNILSRRYPVAQMILKPVLVQGEGAPGQLVKALMEFNREHSCDVIIIGRGGGSAEDLWAFNDEKLAYAIFESEIPVISAVGHETDFTIADFVADLRAPTPSAAAELAVPNLEDVRKAIAAKKATMYHALLSKLQQKRLELQVLQSKPCIQNAGYIIDESRAKIDSLSLAMEAVLAGRLDAERMRFQSCASKLDALSPLKVLSRGYSVIRKDTEIVTSSESLHKQDIIDIQFAEGFASAQIISTRLSESDAEVKKDE